MIDKIFGIVQHYNATDIHLNVGLPPVVRIAGKLKTLQGDPLTASQTEEMMRTVTPPRCQVELSERGSTDFAFSHKNNRYRIAAFRKLEYRDALHYARDKESFKVRMGQK